MTGEIEFSLAWFGFPGRLVKGFEPFGPDLVGVSAEGDSDLVRGLPREPPSFEQEAQFVGLQVEDFGEVLKFEAMRISPDGYRAAGWCRWLPGAPPHQTPFLDGRELVGLAAPAWVEFWICSTRRGRCWHAQEG